MKIIYGKISRMHALDAAVVALLQNACCSMYAKFVPRIAPLAAISGSSRYEARLLDERVLDIDDVLSL